MKPERQHSLASINSFACGAGFGIRVAKTRALRPERVQWLACMHIGGTVARRPAKATGTRAECTKACTLPAESQHLFAALKVPVPGVVGTANGVTHSGKHKRLLLVLLERVHTHAHTCGAMGKNPGAPREHIYDFVLTGMLELHFSPEVHRCLHGIRTGR